MKTEETPRDLRLHAIELWHQRFDTKSICELLGVPEHCTARWIADYRDAMRGQ